LCYQHQTRQRCRRRRALKSEAQRSRSGQGRVRRGSACRHDYSGFTLQCIKRRQAERRANGRVKKCRVNGVGSTERHHPEGDPDQLGAGPDGLGASAVRTEDVRAGHEEPASDQRRRTLVALEAVVVPVTLVERDELRRAQTWIIMHNSTLNRPSCSIHIADARQNCRVSSRGRGRKLRIRPTVQY